MQILHHDDFDRAVVGPIVSKPLLEQIYESVWRLRNIFPLEFELRIYTTRDLYQYIMGHVTIQINEKAARLFGIPVYITEGEGIWWWIGVPGFVMPHANPTPFADNMTEDKYHQSVAGLADW